MNRLSITAGIVAVALSLSGCGAINGTLPVSYTHLVGVIGDVWRAILSRYFCQEELSLFWHIICFSPNACLLHGGGTVSETLIYNQDKL